MSLAMIGKPKVTKCKAIRPPLHVSVASAWVILMLVTALLADHLSPFTVTGIDLSHRLAPPIGFGGTYIHPLGTDELGRDVATRLMHSIQISLLIAFGATIISICFGTIVGFMAAHFRGPVEQTIVMLIDVQASLPFLIVALSILAFFGNTLTLFVCLMGLYNWERNARLARALAISANAQGYAAAVRQLGAHPIRIYFRHILPNTAATLTVTATLSFPEIVLAESGLSFLGLGVQPPLTSLGIMVSYGREYIATAPWIVLAPSLVIVVTTLSISIIGDWLRDTLDPTLR